MAKNNGLYLPLSIDLSAWEQSLAAADADLQKAMREMRSSMKDMKMRYDVEIVGAKLAGDQTKALELENQKLNRVYEEQKKAVEALNRAYQKSVQEKGRDSQATQALATQLIRESRELDRVKRQLDANGLNLGKNISDGLAAVSPEFSRIRGMVQGVTGNLTKMGGAATTAAKALGGIGVAAAGIAAVASALDSVQDGIDGIAKAGLAAADPVYQLRESIQGTYEDAEFLRNVTAVDGSNAESLANALTKLVGTLKKDEDGTNSATVALEKYGAKLLDAQGNAKSYKEMLVQLSNAAQNAAKQGQYADFKSMVGGAFRTTEFDHLLLGLDGYIEKAESATVETKILYEALHEVGDLQNSLDLAKKQREAIIGGAFSGTAQEQLKHEIENAKAINALLDENSDKYREVAEKIGDITTAYIDMKGVATLVWEDIKTDVASAIAELSKYGDTIKQVLSSTIDNASYTSPFFALLKQAKDYVAPKVEEAETNLRNKREEQEQERLRKQAEREMIRETQKQMQSEQQVKQKLTKQQEAELKKQQEAQERFYRELRDLRSSEYEREINQLNDRKQQWINSGIAIVDAEQRFAEEKALIDKKYFDKQQQEREKNLKQAEQAYQKEVEAQKKARESAISDADATTKGNLKLLRYIKKQQEAGTYNEEDVRAYANKLYMKQNGFKQSDIDTAYNLGINKLKELADARTRLFSRFADKENMFVTQQQAPVTTQQNIQPTINISFDNTVVEDMASMQKIADRVSEVITPAIERALRGEQQYGY